MKNLPPLILGIFGLLVIGCSNTYYQGPSGYTQFQSGSLFEKNEYEITEFTSPDGATIKQVKLGKDQNELLRTINKYIITRGIVDGLEQVADWRLGAKELDNNLTQQLGQQSLDSQALDNELQMFLNPQEVPVP